MTKVAVAGGTGVVGTKLVTALEALGHEVVVLARSAGVDLVTGSGLDEALTGVHQIVDVTSTVTIKPKEVSAFFTAVAENLQSAGHRSGVSRIITLSIVGIDELTGGGPYGHYVGKLAQEAATTAGPVPSVILRATQFHEFASMMIQWTAQGPFVPCPRQPAQTVAADTVAEQLARLVDDPSAIGTINLAGPQRLMLRDLLKATAKAQGRRLAVIPVWLPGDTPRRVRNGALLAPADAIIDGPSFDEWIATAYA